MTTRPTLLLVCALLVTAQARAAESPVIIASIPPLAWMVAALAPDTARVETLIPPDQSPHDYRIKPDDMARLQHSTLLVWVGPGLEPALGPAAARLPPGRSMTLLPSLDPGHSHTHKAPANPDHDPHIWLDPLAMGNAAVIVARHLQTLWPDETEDIAERLQAFRRDMEHLDQTLAGRFAPLGTRGFVVYHDGYQRWVRRYGLNQQAAVWHHEGIPTGARERAQLLKLLDSGEIQCLFYEPEHGQAAVEDWLGAATSKVRLVRLDMLGASIPTSKDSYRLLLEDLSGRMAGCLSAQDNAGK